LLLTEKLEDWRAERVKPRSAHAGRKLLNTDILGTKSLESIFCSHTRRATP
jgi:hypothetical protein